ncbi:EF-hand domain-containing protein [Methyloraptor flagellatus]|uniref:EF-hand domain-containing protein n=1 Tax=Methyloraptor flagellatus TaxID=3162530 RepID=A0AAU7X502_9HYPH
MNTRMKAVLLAGVLAVSAGGYAVAQEAAHWRHGPGQGPGRGPEQGPARMEMRIDRLFDRLDANHDGTVTVDEVVAAVDARFDKIDANHDGVIDRTELENWIGRRAGPQRVDAVMRRFDLNGDGKITKAEAEAPAKKLFALFDRKDQGKVTKEDVHLALPNAGMLMGFLAPHHHRHGPHGGPGGMPGEGGPGRMPGEGGPADAPGANGDPAKL